MTRNLIVILFVITSLFIAGCSDVSDYSNGPSGNDDPVMGTDGFESRFTSTYNFTSVAYGNNFFIALAQSGEVCKSDSTGKNWNVTTDLGSSYFTRVKYVNGLFFAFKNYQYFYTSSDGITWTEHNLVSSSGRLVDAAYGNGLYACVGINGVIFTSPDGMTWTQRSSGVAGPFQNIIFEENKFAAACQRSDGSNDGASVYSTDGITWSHVHSFNYGNEVCDIYLITYHKGLFIMFYAFGIYTSPDAIAWTNRYHNGGGFGSIFSAASDGNVCMCKNGYSSDGITWTSKVVPLSSNGHANRVKFTDDLFYAYRPAMTATGDFCVSYDGVNWETTTTSPANINDAIVGAGVIVIVTSNGFIYTTRYAE